VFLLQHLHRLPGGEDDVKTLGIYSSRTSAMSAVDRFRKMPGFRDTPQMADTSSPGLAEGFYLDESELDQDSWSEGYETT
jgi:hypothetical protein